MPQCSIPNLKQRCRGKIWKCFSDNSYAPIFLITLTSVVMLFSNTESQTNPATATPTTRIPKLSNYPPYIPPLTIMKENIVHKGVTFESRPIYLDVQATSPMDPRLIDAMNQCLVEQYGNPHSRTHMFGWETEAVRESIAKLVNADP